jgi:Ala-tRNA(Pro) deacylase
MECMSVAHFTRLARPRPRFPCRKGAVVSLLPCLAEILKRERVPYLMLRHPPVFTAPELSAIAHIPGHRSAKVVICIADGHPLQAVVPAHYSVDLEALRALVRAVSLRLANEEEIARLYPEFEVGAMPPFGMMHGHPVFVDRCFVGEPEMVFNAGTHTDSLCMHYGDFAEIVRPVVGSFGTPPPSRRRRVLRYRVRHRVEEA